MTPVNDRNGHRSQARVMFGLAMIAVLVHLAIIPAQANPKTSRLAPELLRQRARTAPRETVRVIIRTKDQPTRNDEAAIQSAGAKNVRRFGRLNLMAAEVPAGKIKSLAARRQTEWVSEDGVVRASDHDGDPNQMLYAMSKLPGSHIEVATGVESLLRTLANGGVKIGSASPDGYTFSSGNGTSFIVGRPSGKSLLARDLPTIAVFDSGVSPPNNSDIGNNRILARVDFTGSERQNTDFYGHGTHIAGVAAGTGAYSLSNWRLNPGDPTFQGIAPIVNLVDVRVLDENGVGNAASVIAGIDWVLANKDKYNIRIINLSLGGAVTQSYKTDPLCLAVERAVEAGIIVVCAAGNYGKDDQGQPLYGGIVSPANDPYVITVGAINTMQTNARSDDVMATYSSHGPTLVDGLIKPDIVAPGNKIVSLRASTLPGGGNVLSNRDGLASPKLTL